MWHVLGILRQRFEVLPERLPCGRIRGPAADVCGRPAICAGAAGEVAQVVVDTAGSRVAGGIGHQASTASMAGRMADIPPSSRAACCRLATPCWPVRRRYRLSADKARLRPSTRPRRIASCMKSYPLKLILGSFKSASGRVRRGAAGHQSGLARPVRLCQRRGDPSLAPSGRRAPAAGRDPSCRGPIARCWPRFSTCCPLPVRAMTLTRRSVGCCSRTARPRSSSASWAIWWVAAIAAGSWLTERITAPDGPFLTRPDCWVRARATTETKRT
jgi:hypothetical protein